MRLSRRWRVDDGQIHVGGVEIMSCSNKLATSYEEKSLAYALGDVLLGVQLPIDVPHIPAGVTITEEHLLNLSSSLINLEWEPEEENPITKKIKNIVEEWSG